MEEQAISVFELVQLAILLGSLVFILGITVQLYIMRRRDKVFKIKQLAIVLLIWILTLIVTIFFWSWWTFEFDYMIGPVFLPALGAEVIFTPIILWIFKYKII
jgi:hypothetical protein